MPEKLVLDASVLVKWFKKGEECEREALQLFEDALGGRLVVICSEWALLEVVRGLRKAQFPPSKIAESYELLKDLAALGLIELEPVSTVIDIAGRLITRLNLYASDAVHLATSLKRGVPFVTEDEHLYRREVIEYAEGQGVRVVRLKGLLES